MAASLEPPPKLLAWVRDHACGEPGQYQFETLHVDAIEALAGGGSRVRFSYSFDHDGFSQYDKSIHYDGWLELDAALEPVTGEITETRRGEAAS